MSISDDEVRELICRAYPRHDESDDWQNVIDRLALSEPDASGGGQQERRSRRLWVYMATACVAVVVGLLAVIPVWRSEPSLVQRAAAAISVATPKQVLYERSTFQSVGPTGRPFGLRGWIGSGSFQLWVEGGTGQRRFRSVTEMVIPRHVIRGIVKAPAAPWGNGLMELHPGRQTQEIGGTLGQQHVVEADVFQPQRNEIVRFTQAPTAISAISFDPLAVIRQSLTSGNAKSVGKVRLGGREVERIELTLRDIDGTRGTATYYVDVHSQTPVEVVYHHTQQVEFPYLPIFDPTVSGGIAYRFDRFEYLRATAKNLRLTDLRALHPHAKRVCGTEFGLPDC